MKHWPKWSIEIMHKLKSVHILEKLFKIFFYASKLHVNKGTVRNESVCKREISLQILNRANLHSSLSFSEGGRG